jgi:dinuclear metal center YbgI/SA1388 family protein
MKGLELTKIIAKIEQFSPLSLAGSWDNVGLLVEPHKNVTISKIILTNDLTESVVNECIDKNANMILSYHPPIFKPLKRLTKAAWKEKIIISCIANNVAVYSPHTTFDAVNGGVNDWLLIPFGPGESKPLQEVDTGVGPGRLVVLNQPILLNDAIEKLKNHLNLPYLRLAVGVSVDRGSKLVQTIAV